MTLHRQVAKLDPARVEQRQATRADDLQLRLARQRREDLGPWHYLDAAFWQRRRRYPEDARP